VLLILDIQVGLYHIARDWDPSLYQNNIMAHAALGQVFDIPVILSTSADTGPNGVSNSTSGLHVEHTLTVHFFQPLPKEMIEMYPNAPFIRRQGEVKYVTIIPLTNKVLTDLVLGTILNSVLPSKPPARSRSLLLESLRMCALLSSPSLCVQQAIPSSPT
jgi:hypothetical protein